MNDVLFACSEAPFSVLSLSGHERLGEPSSFDLIAPEPVDPAHLLGQPGGAMTMKCTIDGREAAPRSITRQPMNFGQKVPGFPFLSYRIELPWGAFVAAIRRDYEQFLRETIEDEPHDDGSFAEINELRALGWPSLDTLSAQDPDLLLRLVKRFLDLELLDALFPNAFADMEAPAHALRSLDALVRDGDTVRISGDAYLLDLEKLRPRAGAP